MSRLSKQGRSSSTRGRKLKLKARAERQNETRRRIVTAAVELHEKIGPLSTTVTAIADRAGVERLTVYRHFPDERSLFGACTEHYFAAHPPPDLEAWLAIRDPERRLEHGLQELYRYWADNRQMIASVLRDFQSNPKRVGTGTVDFMAAVRDTLTAGWSRRGRKRDRLRASIALAVHFRTWEALTSEGLSDEEAAMLMTDFLRCVAHGDQPPSRRWADRAPR